MVAKMFLRAQPIPALLRPVNPNFADLMFRPLIPQPGGVPAPQLDRGRHLPDPLAPDRRLGQGLRRADRDRASVSIVCSLNRSSMPVTDDYISYLHKRRSRNKKSCGFAFLEEGILTSI